ncbi:MAG: TonB-dependent receptor, partial [Steroidobacteraceae bacterium]
MRAKYVLLRSCCALRQPATTIICFGIEAMLLLYQSKRADKGAIMWKEQVLSMTPAADSARNQRLGLLLAIAMIASTSPARAQVASDAGAGGASEHSALEEIVVTARKVSERLQEVPIAISALSSESLQQRNVGSLDNLAAFVPNFQFDTGAAVSASTFNATAFIRGVGQNDFTVYTDPGVGLYVDGVYLARSTGSALDNFEIERVEVLRGPQGTLFGKSTIGGAINVIMRQPGEEIGGYLQAATGRYDKVYAKGAIDLPLSDTLFTRFAAGYFNKDGYARRLSDGLRQGDKDNVLAWASARWVPT